MELAIWYTARARVTRPEGPYSQRRRARHAASRAGLEAELCRAGTATRRAETSIRRSHGEVTKHSDHPDAPRLECRVGLLKSLLGMIAVTVSARNWLGSGTRIASPDRARVGPPGSHGLGRQRGHGAGGGRRARDCRRGGGPDQPDGQRRAPGDRDSGGERLRRPPWAPISPMVSWVVSGEPGRWSGRNGGRLGLVQQSRRSTGRVSRSPPGREGPALLERSLRRLGRTR